MPADQESGMLPEEFGEHVRGLLAGLGETASQIAAQLTQLGIRGHRDEADRCPIATYLTAAGPGLGAVAVLDHVIEVTGPDGTGVTVPVPVPVAAFVVWFDAGRYPQLCASPLQDPRAELGTPAAAGGVPSVLDPVPTRTCGRQVSDGSPELGPGCEPGP